MSEGFCATWFWVDLVSARLRGGESVPRLGRRRNPRQQLSALRAVRKGKALFILLT